MGKVPVFLLRRHYVTLFFDMTGLQPKVSKPEARKLRAHSLNSVACTKAAALSRIPHSYIYHCQKSSATGVLRQTHLLAEMEDTGSTRMDVTPSVLVVHTAVDYYWSQGLGVGLLQRVACAKTGKTKSDVLATQKQAVKVRVEEFAASKRNPQRRADMIALLKALHMARSTVKKNAWLKPDEAPTTVMILLGCPCKELMKVVTHHIEFGPESYKSLQEPDRTTVKHIIKRIHQIRRAGLKVTVTMSDHHDSDVQIAAAAEAEREFKRVCSTKHKTAKQKARIAPDVGNAAGKNLSITLPIRKRRTMDET